MATRNEKIFKSRTICLMDSILNEINSVIQSKGKTSAKEYFEVQKRIAQSICGFYDKNGITDEEISKAFNFSHSGTSKQALSYTHSFVIRKALSR